MKILLLIFLTAIILTPVTALAVHLIIEPPTVSDVAGCKLYIGPSPGVYWSPIDVGMNLDYVPSLQSGLYYAVATCYDTSGIESGYSNEVYFDAPATITIKPRSPNPVIR